MFGVRGYGKVPFGRYPPASEGHISIIGKLEMGLSTRYEIFVATREFITDNDDTPADQPFAGALDRALSFRRSISSGSGFSGFVSGQGELMIHNSGEFDFLPKFYAVDGRDLEVKLGRTDHERTTIDFSDWFTVFAGTATDAHVEEGSFRIGLADFGYKLEVPLQAVTYAGTGAAEGGDDLAGKRKPLAFGFVDDVSPVLVSASLLIHQIHGGEVQSIVVFVNGVELTFGSDVATYADLAAVSTVSGRYYTCLAEGFYRLNDLGDNEITTARVQGDAAGGFVGTVGTIIRRMVERSTTIIDPDGLYLPAFAQFEIDMPYQAGIYERGESETSVAQAIASLLGEGAYGGFRRGGKFEIVQFAAPSGPPVMRIDEIDIVDQKIDREKLPSDLNPPPWLWRVGWGRNWTVMTGNVAGSVSDERRAFLAEQQRYATASRPATRVDHPFAGEREAGGLLRNSDDAQTEADRLLALYVASRSLYRMTIDWRGFSLEIGDVVLVTYPRWDLTDGRLLRLVEINEDDDDMQVEIVGYG